MKNGIKILQILAVCSLLFCMYSLSAGAITDAEAQAKVTEVGKEAVAGNLFIWFLCAVSFLKVSQKIDSFMSSLGINVGHTGGSMLAEAMIAARGVAVGKRFMGGGGFSSGSLRGASGAGGGAGAFSGGLAGIVGRGLNKGAAQAAVSGGSGGGIGGRLFQSSLNNGGGFANSVIGSIAKGDIASVGTITGDGAAQALSSYMGYTGGAEETGGAGTVEEGFDGGIGDNSNYSGGDVSFDSAAPLQQGVSDGSVESGGVFGDNSATLNTDVPIGSTEIRGVSGTPDRNANPAADRFTGHTGIVGTGGQAGVAGRQGQIGHSVQGESQGGTDNPTAVGQEFYSEKGGGIGHIPDTVSVQNGGISSGAVSDNTGGAFVPHETMHGGAIPTFTDVEIGGGRITGIETSPEHPDGARFGMYSADKYLTPEGGYKTLKTIDGSKWYKQYAVPAVEKTPYNAPDGTVGYNETIVQKLPKIPQRKDRA
jgi:hypothetical protein